MGGNGGRRSYPPKALKDQSRLAEACFRQSVPQLRSRLLVLAADTGERGTKTISGPMHMFPSGARPALSAFHGKAVTLLAEKGLC